MAFSTAITAGGEEDLDGNLLVTDAELGRTCVMKADPCAQVASRKVLSAITAPGKNRILHFPKAHRAYLDSISMKRSVPPFPWPYLRKLGTASVQRVITCWLAASVRLDFLGNAVLSLAYILLDRRACPEHAPPFQKCTHDHRYRCYHRLACF